MSIVNMRVGGKVKKLQLIESFPLNLQEKTATKNGEVVADEGYAGLSKVAVNVPIPEGYIKPAGTKTITANGTHDVSGYANAEVNVPTSGGGSGECSGTHVIEVTELPTENIDENAVYHISSETKTFSDIILIDSGTAVSVRNEYGLKSVYCTTKPTENLVEDTYYYVEDEDTIYGYMSGTLVDLKAQYNYLGVISSASEASTDVDGAYAVIAVVNGDRYYTYSGETVLTDLVVVFGEYILSLREVYPTVEIHSIPTRTSEGILESTEAEPHYYYIQDENLCDVYVNGQWSGENLPITGIYSDISEVPLGGEQCCLIGSVGGWSKYLKPSGSVIVTENGMYDVSTLSKAYVEVPEPSGTITISNNGTYDVKDYASVDVRMPIITTVQTVTDLPVNVAVGSIAIVLEGGE